MNARSTVPSPTPADAAAAGQLSLFTEPVAQLALELFERLAASKDVSLAELLARAPGGTVLLEPAHAAQALSISERTLLRLTVTTRDARLQREEQLAKQLAAGDEKGATQSRERLAEMDAADLPCVRIGPLVRYRPQALAEWAARREEGGKLA